jgi:hypothetical protein
MWFHAHRHLPIQEPLAAGYVCCSTHASCSNELQHLNVYMCTAAETRFHLVCYILQILFPAPPTSPRKNLALPMASRGADTALNSDSSPVRRKRGSHDEMLIQGRMKQLYANLLLRADHNTYMFGTCIDSRGARMQFPSSGSTLCSYTNPLLIIFRPAHMPPHACPFNIHQKTFVTGTITHLRTGR